ncbi:peptidylprolyl isomerase [Maricaulis sp. CAU 1757]
MSYMAVGLVVAGLLMGEAASEARAQGQADADWRAAVPENLLLIELPAGEVVIELADWAAPEHAARMRDAARAGFYDGLSFYRVIEGFVAQGGRGEDPDRQTLPDYPALVGEFTVPADAVTFTPMIDADLYAPEVGHVAGFPAARDAVRGEVWPIHCPGIVAMARDNQPDTGDVEFYIVLGHGPRHLDRIMSVFGRVIDGMEHVQSLHRGDPEINSGVMEVPGPANVMQRVRVVADLPENERPVYEIMRSDGAAFEARKAARRHRTHEFFFETPPEVIEACHMPAPVRQVR